MSFRNVLYARCALTFKAPTETPARSAAPSSERPSSFNIANASRCARGSFASASPKSGGLERVRRARWMVVFSALGEHIDQLFPTRARPAAPHMVRRDIARNREQPRFQRTSGLIRMARLEKRHKHFLVSVVQLVRIGNSPPQELHHGRADILEQRPACLAIALLHALHQVRANPAALRARVLLHFAHSPGGAKSYSTLMR